MIDHLIFDLDGTLIDSAATCAAILNGMLADRGSARVLSRAECCVHMSAGGGAMVAALLGAECGDPTIEIAEFRRRYAALPTPPDCLFAGVRAGLRTLRAAGFRLAICSNKPQPLCDKVLGELGLAPLFDVIVGGAASLRPKPATDLLDLAIARLGTTPDRCLFVGDSELDAAVADAGRLPFLFVTHGYSDSARPTGHLQRFDSFEEVTRFIMRPVAGSLPALAAA